MWLCRWIVKISWVDRVTNDEAVLERMGNEHGFKEGNWDI
jgi:hypothetical protein